MRGEGLPTVLESHAVKWIQTWIVKSKLSTDKRQVKNWPNENARHKCNALVLSLSLDSHVVLRRMGFWNKTSKPSDNDGIHHLLYLMTIQCYIGNNELAYSSTMLACPTTIRIHSGSNADPQRWKAERGGRGGSECPPLETKFCHIHKYFRCTFWLIQMVFDHNVVS